MVNQDWYKGRNPQGVAVSLLELFIIFYIYKSNIGIVVQSLNHSGIFSKQGLDMVQNIRRCIPTSLRWHKVQKYTVLLWTTYS